MRIGFYAGSFDPFTEGHLHVVKTAAGICEKIVIGIGINPNKVGRYDKDIMKVAIEKVLEREKLSNVIVVSYDGLTTDAAIENGATILISGLRNVMDYDYKEILAQVNQEVSGMDTIYIRAGSLGSVSSSLVMDLLKAGKDVSAYVPMEVLEILK
ncbi:MAG: pantetheine-phosphate adenylyltransferase [Oscillospiraceae bacterium]|nr:pantetheine-phosphate adenylyltransferase [Oscillospiraceae bacterium]